MKPVHPQPVPSDTTHLQPDGTVFPPVTPEPPAPPGYRSPVDVMLDGDGGSDVDQDLPV